MGFPKRPLRAIFPILVAVKNSPRVREFLGTGFFVGADGTLLTAKHCLLGLNLREDEEIVAIVMPDLPENLTHWPISGVRCSPQFDIAVARAAGATDIEVLDIATRNPAINEDVVCVEFSGTHSELLSDGTRVKNLDYQNHKGHIVRSYTSSSSHEPVPTQSLDLSFPALRGASGAPAILSPSGAVVGMMLGNVERHLVLAQIERIEWPDGPTEERRYFLPFGKAISWVHLREFVNSIEAERA